MPSRKPDPGHDVGDPVVGPEADRRHDVLKYLEEHRLMPGRDLSVVDVGPDGTLTLEVDGDRVSLGRQLGDNLWVLPA